MTPPKTCPNLSLPVTLNLSRVITGPSLLEGLCACCAPESEPEDDSDEDEEALSPVASRDAETSVVDVAPKSPFRWPPDMPEPPEPPKAVDPDDPSTWQLRSGSSLPCISEPDFSDPSPVGKKRRPV